MQESSEKGLCASILPKFTHSASKWQMTAVLAFNPA